MFLAKTFFVEGFYVANSFFNLNDYDIKAKTIIRNATVPELYEEALIYEPDASISSTGALIVS